MVSTTDHPETFRPSGWIRWFERRRYEGPKVRASEGSEGLWS